VVNNGMQISFIELDWFGRLMAKKGTTREGFEECVERRERD
jgi:hypothetical protein